MMLFSRFCCWNVLVCLLCMTGISCYTVPKEGKAAPPDNLSKKVAALSEKSRTGETVIFIVRHAEKQTTKGERDPGLTDAGNKRADLLAGLLSGANLKAAYSTEFKRTRATVAPAAKAAGITPAVINARDFKGLIQTLKTKHPGQCVLVAGHSNTVPMMLRALGTQTRVTIREDEYSNLFVVTIGPDGGAAAIQLQYGEH